jgi:hypothetical protein
MFRKANNVFSVILNDVNVATSALPAEGAIITNANLPAGAVVLCDMGNRRLSAAAYTALAATDKYFVVQGKGANQPLMKSPAITKGSTTFTIAKHKAAVQQVTYVGYNLTTGSLPVANNSDFWIKVRKRDNDAANRSQPMSLFAGPVKTDSSGTQEELAFALVKNGLKNFAQEPANGYLKFEAVVAGTQADWTGTATHLSVTKGSKVALFTDNAGVPSTVTAPTVGSIIRILNVAYKITASSTTSITLNYAYQGETELVAGGTTAATQAGLVATPGDYGVRLTGVVAPFDVNAFRDYYANRWTTSFSDSGTLITVSGAQNGNGVWQQVAMDEYLNYGFEGENNQLAVPSVPRDQVVKIPGVAGNTAATSRYSALNITWNEDMRGLVAMAPAKGNVIVYLNLDSAGVLDTATANNGETFVVALGLTAADFNA